MGSVDREERIQRLEKEMLRLHAYVVIVTLLVVAVVIAIARQL